MEESSEADLRQALKRTAVALKESGLPFALSGSYAAWTATPIGKGPRLPGVGPPLRS